LAGDMDKEIDKIGVVLRQTTISARQLERMYALEVIEGEVKSKITVYGPTTDKGRLKIRSQEASNAEAARVARQLCNSFKILRKNVEIKNGSEEA